jgi:multicomponent Na+:H+ antiporter subunit F
MSQALEWAVLLGLVVLTINVGLCTLRAVVGPSPFDRIMALECITYNLAGAVVLVSIAQRTGSFMIFLLVVSLLGFIGTIALTSYVERRRRG